MQSDDRQLIQEDHTAGERIHESADKGLVGSGGLQRDPIQAQAIAFQDIQPAGIPTIQAQAAPVDPPANPTGGSTPAA